MNTYGDFRNRRPQGGVWHSLNRLMIALIGLAVILLIACAFVPEMKRQRDLAARKEQLKQEVEKQSALLAQRTREVELLKSDPAYVELMARDRLDMMKGDETIFRLDPFPLDRSNFKRNQ